MNCLRFIFLFVLIAIQGTHISAENIYIQVDEDCLERYEYIINGNTQGDVYVSYTSRNNNGQVAILDVQKENAKWTKSKPDGLRSCSSFSFTKRMVQKINEGDLKIIMVRATDTHFNLTTVKKAIFYEKVGSTLEVISKDADFVFNLDKLVSGIDIALPNSELDVFLEGSVTQQCSRGYIVKKSDGYQSKNYKEMTIVPEIGIVEKRSISSVRGGQRTNILKLDKINHLDYNQYLSERCTEIQADIVDNGRAVPDDFSSNLKDPRANVNKSPSKSTNNGASVSKLGPCGKPMVDGVHIVEKGQTLYSIARQYGVSVSQVQSWNGLKNAMINPCQELRVTAMTVNNNKPASPANDVVTNSKSPATSAPQSSTENYKDGQDYYRVKSGDSMAKLAAKYGYTEDRFRWMNGLSATEDIYPGQVLRTSDCVCPERTVAVENRPQPYDYPTGYDDTSRIVSGYAKKGISDDTTKGTKIYVVRENDTLFSIAKAFQTSVENLRNLNNLSKGEIILPSQRLYVQ